MIVDRKKAAILKAFQRAPYGEHDYLREYKSQVGIYVAWEFYTLALLSADFSISANCHIVIVTNSSADLSGKMLQLRM